MMDELRWPDITADEERRRRLFRGRVGLLWFHGGRRLWTGRDAVDWGQDPVRRASRRRSGIRNGGGIVEQDRGWR
jgi:hypothetical protein